MRRTSMHAVQGIEGTDMGTPAAYGVIAEGAEVWSYGNNPGEPSMGGARYADIARRLAAIPAAHLTALVRRVRLVAPYAAPSPEDTLAYKRYSDSAVNGGQGYYALLRDIHGDVETQLYEGIMLDARADGCNASFAYMADFDAGMFFAWYGWEKGEAGYVGQLIFKMPIKGLSGRAWTRRFSRNPNWF